MFLDQKLLLDCLPGAAPLVGVAVLALSACIGVPPDDELIAFADGGKTRRQDASCAQAWPEPPPLPETGTALDPSAFSLMTWNVHKVQAAHWPHDFVRLTAGQDLVLLQEAHLTPQFRAALDSAGFGWTMARAFHYNGAEAGVLTAGRTPASGACLTRSIEPLIRTPKTALVTRHPLGSSARELWVANLHGINFTLGTERFEAQLRSLAEAVEPHSGALILAGDFNDWNEQRTVILHGITRRLGLTPLTLHEDERSRHFGRPVDHVFYRALEVVAAASENVSSSDHNPIRVTFRVPEDAREETR